MNALGHWVLGFGAGVCATAAFTGVGLTVALIGLCIILFGGVVTIWDIL